MNRVCQIYSHLAFLIGQRRNIQKGRIVLSGTGCEPVTSSNVVNPLLYPCQGLRYRKLEVFLTTSIEKLGKAGEIVKVAPGYFRDNLMPKLLAVPNIDKFAYLIREQRKVRFYYEPSVSIRNKEGFLTRSIAKPPNDHLLAVAWKRCNDLMVSWLLKPISPPIASTIFYMTDAIEI
ncbi:hypothetical protein L6164_028502 [Bauhinia variegata]|uniref:Uncharacterized protein n=1 Tax=Bauhinia variegata TaxID=167791 RepID=A0ACB9L6R6_BAUVA|nr:hypothetical protein L6164_028502 [Bauhinia variegata]